MAKAKKESSTFGSLSEEDKAIPRKADKEKKKAKKEMAKTEGKPGGKKEKAKKEKQAIAEVEGAFVVGCGPESLDTEKSKTDKKPKKAKKAKKEKEKKEKRKREDVDDASASAMKKQRASAAASAPPAADEQLRLWRVTLRGLSPAASAADISELLAPTLSLPAEMIRLPPDVKTLSEGEASFTVKVAAEADAVRGLQLGSGVSVGVEEVAAGTDEEVFVRYLPFVATSQEVEDLFAAQGNVVKVKLMPGAHTHPLARAPMPFFSPMWAFARCRTFARSELGDRLRHVHGSRNCRCRG